MVNCVMEYYVLGIYLQLCVYIRVYVYIYLYTYNKDTFNFTDSRIHPLTYCIKVPVL